MAQQTLWIFLHPHFHLNNPLQELWKMTMTHFFSKNKEIIQLLKPIVYNYEENEPSYNLINEKKVFKMFYEL